jgi:hypothetical protein
MRFAAVIGAAPDQHTESRIASNRKSRLGRISSFLAPLDHFI